MDMSLLLFPSAASFPSLAMNWFEWRPSLERLLISHPHTTYYAYVVGHSLRSVGNNESDRLVINRALDAVNRVIKLEAFTLKRPTATRSHCWLHAAHSAHLNIEVSGHDAFAIWRTITQVIQSLDETFPYLSAKRVE